MNKLNILTLIAAFGIMLVIFYKCLYFKISTIVDRIEAEEVAKRVSFNELRDQLVDINQELFDIKKAVTKKNIKPE